MIDLRVIVNNKPEWSLRNPCLSQSCNIQTIDMEMSSNITDMTKIPGLFPTPASINYLEGVTTSAMDNIPAESITWSTADDKLSYLLDNLTNSHKAVNVEDPSTFLQCHHTCQTIEQSRVMSSVSVPTPRELNLHTTLSSPSRFDSYNLQIPSSNIHSSIPSHMTKPSELSRQTSLNIVMEVLGTCPVSEQDQFLMNEPFSATPSPSVSDDFTYIQHPSPSYLPCDASISAPTRNRTLSGFDPVCTDPALLLEDNSRVRTLSADDVYSMTGILNSVTTFTAAEFETKEENNNGETRSPNNNDNDSSVDEGTPCSQPVIESSTVSAVPPLESLPSFIRENLQNVPSMEAMAEDSLDMQGMMDDFMQSTSPEQEVAAEEFVTIEVIDTEPAPATILESSSVQTQQSFGDPQTPAKAASVAEVIVDLTNEEPCCSASVPQLKRTASYIRKRSQNNQACRESRRKRKVERDEAESKVAKLNEDNVKMRAEILRLEEEVRDTRATLIAAMTKVSKR